MNNCTGCLVPRVLAELDGERHWVCENISCSDSILYVAQEYMDDVDWSPSDYEPVS